MRFNYLTRYVHDALVRVYAHDFALFQKGVSEWAIAHRLAVYLERDFGGWHIDCEYNRQGINSKKRNDAGALIRPDIIIHHRGEGHPDHNLLVIEVKLLNEDSDSKKACSYTKPAAGARRFQYQYGLALSFEPTSKLVWYCNGRERRE
jgi:hypothetical protein